MPMGAMPRLFMAVAQAVGSDIGNPIRMESRLRFLPPSGGMLLLFLFPGPLPSSAGLSDSRGPAVPSPRDSLLAGSKDSWFKPERESTLRDLT